MLTKITRHGQITLPKRVRDQLHLVTGDYVDVELTGHGILLKPKKGLIIDAEQAYYWTQEWQAKEKAADADQAAGRVHPLHNVHELDSD